MRSDGAEFATFTHAWRLMMKRFLTYLCLPVIGTALVAPLVMHAQAPEGKDLSWAFPVPDKEQPKVDAAKTHQLAGSTLSLTPPQINDLLNPPDWYPSEHAAPPKIVVHGTAPNALACGSCHLMNGQGHPESAQLAGLPAGYIIRQMEYFKASVRKDPARMNGIAKQVSEEDVIAAAAYFSALKPVMWTKVVETDTVPKSRVGTTRMRLHAEGGGMEPIGMRIVTLPNDDEKIEERDPHTGFTAYVPKGALKKGEALVKTGAKGKTLQCSICHGTNLQGIGDVPGIAGMHPIYITRMLYAFKGGNANGGLDQLMKQVVEKLTDEDILDISAYVASVQR